MCSYGVRNTAAYSGLQHRGVKLVAEGHEVRGLKGRYRERGEVLVEVAASPILTSRGRGFRGSAVYKLSVGSGAEPRPPSGFATFEVLVRRPLTRHVCKVCYTRFELTGLETSSSAAAERPREPLSQLKACQLLRLRLRLRLSRV